MADGNALYQRFLSSRQEAIKLQLALYDALRQFKGLDQSLAEYIDVLLRSQLGNDTNYGKWSYGSGQSRKNNGYAKGYIM